MGTAKRERQKAGRRARIEEEMTVQTSERRKRQVVRWVIIIALAVGAIVLYSVFTGDDDSGEPAPVALADGCPPEDGSGAVTSQFDGAPPLCIDVDTFYAAELDTSLGTMQIVLDPTRDSASVNNFVFLARNRAYEDILFHRVIEGFMVQGGDVQGLNGTGGPGYTFEGGNPEPGQYRVGSLAMANNGSDPATNGSQFFIVTGPNGVALPPNFSLFGQVIDGIDVALDMQAVATAESDKPEVDVVINSITITEASAAQVESYNEAIG